ncbi:UNVERIFIED_CONTAM: velvet protein [Siphonaria sp. JEL0065]|nr:velvet protein [Siphonaria sp. JEL0065]
MPLTTLLCAAAAVEDFNSRFKDKREAVGVYRLPGEPSNEIVSPSPTKANSHALDKPPSLKRAAETSPLRVDLAGTASFKVHESIVCGAAKNLDPDPAKKESPQNKYRCSVVQQPERARVCGYSISDRRPIHPPPIVKLEGKYTGNTSSLVMFASLWSQDLQQDLSYSHKSIEGPSLQYTPLTASKLEELDVLAPSASKKAKYTVLPSSEATAKQVLMGQMVSVCSTLMNPDHSLGYYFVFSDLAVRTSGYYRLRFDMYEMSR